jgi:hypothetical protein
MPQLGRIADKGFGGWQPDDRIQADGGRIDVNPSGGLPRPTLSRS